tara:strand:+ start:27046 stop:27882 length:837 start_codon:yes stop_codon:yes gene_type:complete
MNGLTGFLFNVILSNLRSLACVLVLVFGCAAISYAETDVKTEDRSWWSFFDSQDDQVLVLKVAEPFVNLRSGPASGYPIFHVSERGEQLTILSRKTDWIKVKDASDRSGWVSVSDVEKMHNLSGSQVILDEPKFEDFTTHPWEAGLLAGNFDQSAVNSAYLGYWMTENLSLELWASQVLGEASESKLVNINIVHQVFPTWRFSPFFTLGAGKIFIKPKSTLSSESARNEDTLNAGVGLRYYLSNRYFLRFEFKDYKIFTNRETNEEASEWKLGLSVFF